MQLAGSGMVSDPSLSICLRTLVMTKFEAIQFLASKDESCNEWHEAGMWVCVRRILNESEDKRFTEDDLQALLEYAAKY